MSVTQIKSIVGADIPDSIIAKRATELILEQSTALFYNHLVKVFLFASLNGQHDSLKYDAELLYACSIFHDFGLMPHHRGINKQFGADSANAIRDFLRRYGLPEAILQLAWDTIAFHITIGFAEYKETQVALMHSCLNVDITGEHNNNLSKETRLEVVTAFSRTGFKKKILPTFFEDYSQNGYHLHKC